MPRGTKSLKNFLQKTPTRAGVAQVAQGGNSLRRALRYLWIALLIAGLIALQALITYYDDQRPAQYREDGTIIRIEEKR